MHYFVNLIFLDEIKYLIHVDEIRSTACQSLLATKFRVENCFEVAASKVSEKSFVFTLVYRVGDVVQRNEISVWQLNCNNRD